MSKWFCAGIALLLVVGLTRADEKPQYAYGVMESLDVKDGVGILTILGAKRKQDRPKVMKLAITKDTKFYYGGTYGPNDTPGKLGDPVDPAKVTETLGNKRFLWILYTVDGDKLTVTVVNVTA